MFTGSGAQRMGGDVAGPAADQQDTIDGVGLELGGDAGDVVGRGHEAVGAQVGAGSRHPAADTHPRHLLDAALGQPAEPVADGQQRVAAVHPHAHRHAHGRVHPGGGPTGVEHGQSQRPLAGFGAARPCLGHRPQQPVRVAEASTAQPHRLLAVPIGDCAGDRSCRGDALEQRRRAHAVAADADQLRLVVRRVEELANGGVPEHGAQVAVERARRAAPLHVPEDGHAGVVAEALEKDLSHMVGCHRLTPIVASSFGDEHDARPPADAASCTQDVTHRLFPVLVGRALRDQHEVGTRRQASHEGQVPAVASHHLDHERALMTRRRALDGVDGLGDAVQCGVSTDRHVGADHVVVDRPDEADERHVAVRIGVCLVDVPFGHQLVEQVRPLRAQLGCAAEAAVAADDDQGVHTALDEVARRLALARARAEVGAAGGAEGGPSLLQDAADIGRGQRPDVVAAVDETLQALVHPEHVEAGVERRAHDSPHRGVHPGGVASAGEHCEFGRHRSQPMSAGVGGARRRFSGSRPR